MNFCIHKFFKNRFLLLIMEAITKFYSMMKEIQIANVNNISIGSMFKVSGIADYTFGINLDVLANEQFFDYSKIASWYGGVAKMVVDGLGDFLQFINGSFIMLSYYDTHLRDDGRFIGVLIYSSTFKIESSKVVRVPFAGSIGMFFSYSGPAKFVISNQKTALLIDLNDLNDQKTVEAINEKLGMDIDKDKLMRIVNSLNEIVKQMISLDMFFYNTIKLWSQGYVQNPSLVGPYKVEIESS